MLMDPGVSLDLPLLQVFLHNTGGVVRLLLQPVFRQAPSSPSEQSSLTSVPSLDVKVISRRQGRGSSFHVSHVVRLLQFSLFRVKFISDFSPVQSTA
ncbi:hypothetical protein F2P81_024727 [Scophthalmus maximus]|uniref:Uncharacterized protein n=1 Tax=Scophthalmus maximus TaxID=52904 RepID=A0A6A4RJU0_SCOMX|nr:hypothetical protein F2P81_024727 [Scophthalmus maximus]